MEARARVKGAGMSRTAAWLSELESLTVRFGTFGIGPDLASLTLADAWGLYRYLSRVAVGG